MNTGIIQHRAIHILLITVAVVLVYSSTIHAPFVFDDGDTIVKNPALRDFSFFLHPSKIRSLPIDVIDTVYNFKTRYVANLSFAVNYSLGGLNPAGYHIFNIGVHIINSVLVYLLIAGILRAPYFANRDAGNTTMRLYRNKTTANCHCERSEAISSCAEERLPRSPERDLAMTTEPPRSATERLSTNHDFVIPLFGAMLFAVHPMQTQAVTYLTQRYASLATLFYLLSTVLYIRFRGAENATARLTFYLAALAAAVFGMFTKENAVTLPVMVAIVEFLFFTGAIRRRVMTLAPLLFIAAIIPVVLFMEGRPVLQGIGEPPFTRWEYFLTQFTVAIKYLRLYALPIGQNLDHDVRVVKSFFDPYALSCLSLLLMIFLTGVYWIWSSLFHNPLRRLAGFGVMWMFVTAFVESGAFPIGVETIFEHRMYLPSVGLFMSVSAILFMVAEKRRVLTVAAVVCVFVFAVAAHARNHVWRSEISLWGDAVNKSPQKPRPRLNLGLAYKNAGMLDEAIKEYQAVLALDPNNAKAFSNLGMIYMKRGNLDEARTMFEKAVASNPMFADAWHNLGVLYGMMEKPIEAAEALSKTLSINYYNATAHNVLGIVNAMMKNYATAEKEFRAALSVDPSFDEARANLADLLAETGRQP